MQKSAISVKMVTVWYGKRKERAMREYDEGTWISTCKWRT